MASYRTVIESQQFEADRRRILSHPRLLDEILEATILLLSRRPEQGQGTAVPGVLIHFMQATPLTPALAIYYAYSHDEVHLLSIRLAEEAIDDI